MCRLSHAVVFILAILTIACSNSSSGGASSDSSDRNDDSESVALRVHFSVRRCVGDTCDSRGTSLDDTVHIKLENRGRGFKVDHFGKWEKVFVKDGLEFDATITIEKISREDIGEFYRVTAMVENPNGAHGSFTRVPDISLLYDHEVWCTNVKIDETIYMSNLSLEGTSGS